MSRGGTALRLSRLALAACAAMLIVPAADAAGKQGSPEDPRAKRFVKEISVARMVKHQARLQQLASATGGTREVFSPGYQASLDYVKRTLERSGYDVDIDMFNYPFWEESQPPVLNLTSVEPDKVYRPGDADDSDQDTADFITMANSRAIDLQDARVVPTTDIVDPPTGGSTSGCQPEDYPAEVAGAVALVQRGTCAFVEKWALAEEAGALGVIIYNEGNTPERQNPIFIDNGIETEIAAVITSYALGNELLQAYKAGQNPTVDFQVFGQFTDRFLPQVITETRSGDRNNVVVVGAHLDSVPEGPGINDDGSGIALLLTMAQELAERRYHLRQKIRFAWWGAEENGLVGSQYYAHRLSDAEIAKIDVMLDYDMLASANFARLVYDGDGNAEPGNPAGPPGSGLVEQVHADWLDAQGLHSERIPFDGRSDYVGFTDEGIPAGGVFSGAEVEKTPEQEAIYGGDAGSWYDPCYHQACDNFLTVLTGVPPWNAVEEGGAEGLETAQEEPATEEQRRAAALKMAGGSLRGFKELAGAASYATWYFSHVRDPFGTNRSVTGKRSVAKRAAAGKRSARRITARPDTPPAR
jgi:Zn-dependent M28 family amino/carboxypeptidase